MKMRKELESAGGGEESEGGGRWGGGMERMGLRGVENRNI